eukprot:scaffold23014_cov71-Cyclotella_meneghiniana.AAC.1
MVYVLDPKLQDGKKLPKWNRHARMGQFLGFSRQHSSTVALVQIHTGYVSPQYHVVFDGNFQTVFNDGKTSEEVDKICNQLIVESRDCYVQEEYDDEDGVLIYSPPPLDEVWLSEPERRERRHELEKRRNIQRCHRDNEIEEIHRRMKKS